MGRGLFFDIVESLEDVYMREFVSWFDLSLFERFLSVGGNAF